MNEDKRIDGSLPDRGEFETALTRLVNTAKLVGLTFGSPEVPDAEFSTAHEELKALIKAFREMIYGEGEPG